VRRGQLLRVLRHDAGEAVQRQSGVVRRSGVGRGRRGLSGCVARFAGIRPHQKRKEAENGNEDAEQQRRNFGEHSRLGLNRP
jgi:hypothetical protein